jgi:NADH-quinone oxidoreductase subunit N
VYEGSPTTITAFMATAVKVAAFGVLVRVMAVAFDASQTSFDEPL